MPKHLDTESSLSHNMPLHGPGMFSHQLYSQGLELLEPTGRCSSSRSPCLLHHPKLPPQLTGVTGCRCCATFNLQDLQQPPQAPYQTNVGKLPAAVFLLYPEVSQLLPIAGLKLSAPSCCQKVYAYTQCTYACINALAA